MAENEKLSQEYKASEKKEAEYRSKLVAFQTASDSDEIEQETRFKYFFLID